MVGNNKSKDKRQPGMCDFMIYPGRGGGGYAARLYEGEPHKCGRPATVRREGQNFCKRHDSELSDSDVVEIDRIVGQADVQEEMERRIEERQRQQEQERQARSEAIRERFRQLAEQRQRQRQTPCAQCNGTGRNLVLEGDRWICYSCRAQLRRAERLTRYGMLYGRGMPLNVSRGEPHIVSAPEPESKPLQEQFGGKRRFLEDD